MKRLTWVIWMICWPLSMAICNYLSSLTHEISTDVRIGATLFETCIWLFFAGRLWKEAA